MEPSVDDGVSATITCSRPSTATAPPSDYFLTIARDDANIEGPANVNTLTHTFTPDYDQDEGSMIECWASNDVGSSAAAAVALTVKREFMFSCSFFFYTTF